MINYPATILPPNAKSVEKAIDRASASTLSAIPFNIVRWVKDPDSCPLELLPWLAWEYQVDTWNTNWTEKEKRDAIKRAPYIHRHRGTPAAVRRALVDSPFGTEIIEWFQQQPMGDPYTFRLNVYQNDLPVTEYDHQDLKHAVMRAKNLRSWFSVHVFGRLSGVMYGAGYMTATERIGPATVPQQIFLSKYEIYVAPGDFELVGVTILPENSDDKSFTVTTSDGGTASAKVLNGAVQVKGIKRGQCQITVTTASGSYATISVNVVSVTKFISRIDSLNKPLFYASLKDNFTIDYGDGVDSNDYRIDAQGSYGWVFLTRNINLGEEITFKVKNSDTLAFYSATVKYVFNPLIEIVSINSDRLSLANFARGHKELRKVHDQAFYDLPECTNFAYLFYGSGLSVIPNKLFLRNTKATIFASSFSNCGNITILPNDLFSYCPLVITFERVFEYCTGIQKIPDGFFDENKEVASFAYSFFGCKLVQAIPVGLFKENRKVLTFAYTFYGCVLISEIPKGIFDSNELVTSFEYTFAYCTFTTVQRELFYNNKLVLSFAGTFFYCVNLLAIPSGFFDKNTLAQKFDSTFRSCSPLKEIPDGLFDYNVNALSFGGVFSYCKLITKIPDGLFDNNNLVTEMGLAFGYTGITAIPAKLFFNNPLVTSFASVFCGCDNLLYIPIGLFDKCTKVTTFARAFYGCSLITTIPDGLFNNHPLVTTFAEAFSYCISILAVPKGLFDNNSLVTTFAKVFSNCQSLYDVPNYLFANCPLVTTFDSAFLLCSSLKIIHSGIFKGCSLVTTFIYVFRETSIIKVSHRAF